MRNADKPITPVALGVQNTDAHALENGDLIGLTKREYFVAMAMQGVLIAIPTFTHEDMELGASICVKMADSLLAELDKPQP